MNETLKTETCDRTEDLMSVLYGEATESEAYQFHQHLRICDACQKEMTSLGQLRDSIEAWKLEALSGFRSSPVALETQPRTKSAIAALRTFFDLSPLWLKGATAFATLLFVVFAVVAFSRLNSKQPAIAGYTEEQKNEIVQNALQEQKALLASQQAKIESPTPPASEHQPQQRKVRSTQMARGRRPLTRWEREQLAADLRLLQQQDNDDGPQLIIDRMNQE
jgi:anti-sigma factor RsiW